MLASALPKTHRSLLIRLFIIFIGRFHRHRARQRTFAHRTNERIRARTVRLIDDKGEQIGIISIEKALELAKERELDLVEISPKINPPICKLLDFGKFLYHKKKLEKKQNRQKQTETKGIRLSLRTDVHDLEIKAKKAKSFLAERNLVKVALVLRGREFAHMDLARKKLYQFADMLKEVAIIEENPKKTGNVLVMILNPS